MLKDPAPVAYLVNFAPDGLEFSLNFWVADPAKGQVNVKSAINISILEGLRAAGIDIPNPQRVVHVQPSAPENPPVPLPGSQAPSSAVPVPDRIG